MIKEKKALATMWNIYNTVNELIRFSDTKAGALLALNGIVLTIIASKVIDYGGYLASHGLLLIFLIFIIASGIASILFSISCINPILTHKSSNSIIYFGNISKSYNSYTDYKLDVIKKLINNDDELDQIAEQVWTASGIAREKYRKISWAMRFLILEVILIIIFGVNILFI